MQIQRKFNISSSRYLYLRNKVLDLEMFEAALSHKRSEKLSRVTIKLLRIIDCVILSMSGEPFTIRKVAMKVQLYPAVEAIPAFTLIKILYMELGPRWSGTNVCDTAELPKVLRVSKCESLGHLDC